MKIHLKGFIRPGLVWLNGKELKPDRSLRVKNHSTKFTWGSGGNGAAQLALAILLEVYTKNFALKNYRELMWSVIEKLPKKNIDIDVIWEPGRTAVITPRGKYAV